jgi:DNA polymerase-3 subunit alpha
LAYQTGYLKANYPQEYMAAVLTHNMSDIKKVSFFMNECKRMRVPVLGPDVNESAYNFTVNKAGAIRFGMGAVKGLGQAAVENIIQERKENGAFEDIFDLAQRVDLRQVNKRSLESLAFAGAFDAFQNGNRAVFVTPEGDGTTWIEKAIRYGQILKKQEDTAQVSLFGDVGGVDVIKPEPPNIPRWNNLMRLKKEREVVGIYISAHPLDDVYPEMKFTTNTSLENLADPLPILGKDLRFGALVLEAQHRVSKAGKKWGTLMLEDLQGNFEFNLFSEDYQKFQHLIQEDLLLWVRGAFERKEYTTNDGQSRSEIRFRVREIKLLNEMLDKGIDKVKIEFELKELDTAFYQKLFGVLNKYKGKQKYEISVFDTEARLGLNLPSRGKGIRICRELLQELDEIPKIRVLIP